MKTCTRMCMYVYVCAHTHYKKFIRVLCSVYSMLWVLCHALSQLEFKNFPLQPFSLTVLNWGFSVVYGIPLAMDCLSYVYFGFWWRLGPILAKEKCAAIKQRKRVPFRCKMQGFCFSFAFFPFSLGTSELFLEGLYPMGSPTAGRDVFCFCFFTSSILVPSDYVIIILLWNPSFFISKVHVLIMFKWCPRHSNSEAV